MDKKRNYYTENGQELTIENIFSDDVPVKDMIKAYIQEKQKNRIHMSVLDSEQSHEDRMDTVSSKGGCG